LRGAFKAGTKQLLYKSIDLSSFEVLVCFQFLKIEDSWLLSDNEWVSYSLFPVYTHSCKFYREMRRVHTLMQRLPWNGAGTNQSNESYTRDLRACNL